MSKQEDVVEHLDADIDRLTAQLAQAEAQLGVKPHMHPPSLERCDCTNRSRFRIPITSGEDKSK